MSAYLKLDSDLYLWRTTPESDDYDDLVTGHQKALAESHAEYGVTIEPPADDPDVLFVGISYKGIVGGTAIYDTNRLDSQVSELWPKTTAIPSVFLEARGGFSKDKRVTPYIARSVHHAMAMTGHTHTLCSAPTHSVRAWKAGGAKVQDVPSVEYPKGYDTYLLKWTFGDVPNREVLIQEMSSWQQV